MGGILMKTTRKEFLMAGAFLAGGLGAAAAGACRAAAQDPAKPNILFIAVDDMNDWIGPLSNHLPRARTPNLDRLAATGVNFTNAHCASPVCHPSRLAVMTGVHPSRSGVMRNTFGSTGAPTWRSGVLADAVTLSQHFRNHGYKALGTGKIYHALQWWPGSECPAEDWDAYYPRADAPIPEWVRPELTPDAEAGLTPGRPLGGERQLFGTKPLDVPDAQTSDYKVVDWAVEQLHAAHDQPLFLACGIFRPHIPWEVPRKYFEMYPLEEVQLPPHREDDLADAFAHSRRHWHQWVRENGLWKEFVRGYLASITYADRQIGRLLSGLARSPHQDNTVVVLWSDHGMHIGEKENWEKFTLWEQSTRVPLLFIAPGVTRAGTVCASAVSLIDVYPTLCALAGIPAPKQCDGDNLVPLLQDVTAKRSKPVVTSYQFGEEDTERNIGHSVRTDRWRYIHYEKAAEELYDHANDPHEYHNLAKKPEHADILRTLKKHLPEPAGW